MKRRHMGDPPSTKRLERSRRQRSRLEFPNERVPRSVGVYLTRQTHSEGRGFCYYSIFIVPDKPRIRTWVLSVTHNRDSTVKKTNLDVVSRFRTYLCSARLRTFSGYLLRTQQFSRKTAPALSHAIGTTLANIILLPDPILKLVRSTFLVHPLLNLDCLRSCITI